MLYPREIFLEIKKVISRDEFIILTGARQVGKTSLLIMLKNFLEEKGGICHYLNLENPDHLKLLDKHPFNIFELFPESKGKQNVFIDEIQYLNDPSSFLKLLYDSKRDKIKIISSGSSAFYIDKKFKDSLAGRKFLFEIHPLNFDESLVFNGREDLLKQKNKRLSVHYKERLLDLWQKYLIYGGYPKVVLEEDDEVKRIVLEEIGSSYVKMDVRDAGIKNTQKYFSLLKILAAQTGNLLNSQELANTLGMAHKTVEEYLYVMKKSYQIALINPFYKNLRKELTKMPKVYFYDLGLRNFFLGNYTPIDKRWDKGAYLENIAFREFLREKKTVDRIKFWRTQDKKEVDFVIDDEAFEIKFESGREKKKKYEQFRRLYPRIKFNFLTYPSFLEKFYNWKL
ncbi:MAG: ATP-binding protein [Candidatus Omnitrophica bacterium]|nr:ATP-binding protein [Candidatus Omnitrophota bacterium]MBU1128123.1 ATP-binding protein [Candidatus Omnitrophota bacterium]MBU1784877.1 ATP-binding protein [Candidatus Omnitrophota bacterium]MBU1850815.1 ATP-binding protein [Candidatus Omnitrophota bacterium]